MTKTILNIKTDPDTKKQLQEFAAELGVPVSVIMNAQIKQMLRDRKIILSTELEPTPYLVKIMEEVEEDLKTGRNMSPVFTSAKDMLEHLENSK
jgi:antitoxin component of RelBE/YafQ-DinJ toxin-antitoxin module